MKMSHRHFRTLAVCCAAALGLTGAANAQSYHVSRTALLGGAGGWDLFALDTAAHRLFIARQDRVMVVDPDSGKTVAEIPGFERAHGIAFAYEQGRGFATSGADSAVVMFDLKSLKVLARIPAAPDADGILYDPVSHRILTFNGTAHSATVIDPAEGKRVGTIELQGAPEFAVSSGNGSVYVNLEDQAAIAEIAVSSMTVTRHWSIAPCESPTGLAFDRAHQRLFSGCRNGVMAISDAAAGRVITTLPIGQGVDACRFDSSLQVAFASNGAGSVTVVREDAPDRFHVVTNVVTRRGARTMELDQKTHRIYTASADFGPAPAATPDHPRPRPPVIPGTFTLIVLEP